MSVHGSLKSRINLTIEPDVKAYMSELARLQGLSLSEYLRNVFRAHMNHTMRQPLLDYRFNIVHTETYGVVHIGGITYPYCLMTPVKDAFVPVSVQAVEEGLLIVKPI